MNDAAIPSLAERLPTGPVDPDVLLDIFLDWSFDRGFELYPAQEEAALEIFGGSHVVLNTPTGSGKSMVALAMHFYSFAMGQRSYYTSPIKALVSEKFFDLCQHFGADNVGMLTGDASINKGAPIICCTAEILAATALSEGRQADVQHAIMDEFHYYGDRDRGIAWQLPLLLLPDTTFLLMSATLGDTKKIADQVEARTGRPVSVVKSTQRPVPLEFVYSTEPLIPTIEDLVRRGKAPLYVVNFTQRDCAELAQSLTSINFCTKEEKKAIQLELKGGRFDTPYGKTIRKYLSHGIALHHGGLLPKYRLMVEGLAQKGHLKIICGTDTLGVGINLPIRTVLFTKLCKFDGTKVRLLQVRDFKQIAGRAGRKGFDDEGLVVCQAPAHVIENMRIASRISNDPKKKKKLKRKSAPDRGYVHWDKKTFERLTSSDSEPLKSRFTVNHAIFLGLLQRPEGSGCGYRALIDLIALSHETPHNKSRLRRKARMLFQSLRTASILEVAPRDDGRRGMRAQLADDLQRDFSIHHALSLFLVYAVSTLDPDTPDAHLKAASFSEAILEEPWAVLRQQKEKMRSRAYATMKAEGVDYEERQEKLEKITWPMPDADLILATFEAFTETAPWVVNFEPRPKSVARDRFEVYASFNDYIKQFGLERSEGVLLRHLTQVYKTMRQNIPESLKTEHIHEMIAYLRELLTRTDSSLLQAWEGMRDGASAEDSAQDDGPAPMLDLDPKAFKARVRAELRGLMEALSYGALESATFLVRHDEEEPWTQARFAAALEPFYATYDAIVYDHDARATDLVNMSREAPGLWRVTQVLSDPSRDNFWYLRGTVDVRPGMLNEQDERLFTLEAIEC